MQMSRTTARRLLSSYMETPVARALAAIGLTPNVVTLAGLVVAGVSAYLIGAGFLWAGGVVLLVSGLFDMFDGALARITDRASDFGALLDSVVDRISEAAVLLGLLVFYLQRSSTEGAVLVYLALAGSVLVSYVRARAEGLGIDCKTGVMTRPERVVILGLGLVISHWWLPTLLFVLGIIATLTFVTSAQRLMDSRSTLANGE